MKIMNSIQKKRLSNFELLRIVAMLLVMFGHSHIRLTSLENEEHSFMVFVDSMSACIATMGVGVFVAISGWFGIKFKLKGLLIYIFQILFILWGIYGAAIYFDVTEFDTEGVKTSLGFYDGYWFVISYLGLYIISPILNSFIENASKKSFQTVLLSLMLFQCYFSWITAWFDYYNGYSIVLFSVIYLIAAYFRKYPIEWVEKNSFGLLTLIIFTMAIIATVSLLGFENSARQVRDDNPLVILAEILLLLCFKKMKFQSRIINWLAASCFTVYLIHYSPFVYPYFMWIIKSLYNQYNGIGYVMMLLVVLFAIYICCTIIDQVRILAWNGLTLFKSHKKESC